MKIFKVKKIALFKLNFIFENPFFFIVKILELKF